MKDEIKEILDMLKQHISIISVEDEDLLLDYITNLQEENERLKSNCNIGNENLTFYRNSYKDYKTRIDKAIEYIENNKQLSMFADLRKEGTHQYTLECDADDLLEILQGKSDE